jgi:preprotein translocase subunit SecA
LTELAGESEPARELLRKKEEELGRDIFLQTTRGVCLQTLDLLWVEHLESMEYLRGSVNLRAYGQRDPLVEYRKEGTRTYKQMEEMFRGRVFEMIEKLSAQPAQGATPTPAVTPPVFTVRAPGEESIGRNDPCPCGSGKKWKNCGLKNTDEHQRLIAAKK